MRKIIFVLIVFMSLILHSQEKGIINNANSPHIKFKSIDIKDCKWTEGFWAEKFKVAEEVMVPNMGTILKGDIGGALNNFKIVAGIKEGKHFGTNWHDGDFYKWMEAMSYLYAQNKNPKLIEELDEIITIIGKAQAKDGYISTSTMLKDIERYSNTRQHELYNSGHLLTSACIHYRITGKSNFLEIAIKHADFLYKTFQPQTDELMRFGFNPTQITGLIELYRTTKDKRYLELAQIFIDKKGTRKEITRGTSPNFSGDMNQDRIPFRNQKTAEGHAVLGMYLYAGAADLYAETGEKAILISLDRIWDNVTNKKMYVTGALGQTHHGASSHNDLVHEAFINEYMMHNDNAYNETCANICNAMFNYRMLGITGDAKHTYVMELVLYNSALSGISVDGKNYFYTNPLRRHDKSEIDNNVEFGTRVPYIKCFCCPPNLVRTIAKLSGWAYSLTKNGVAVNLYGGNELNTKMLDGSTLKIVQKSAYPWKGNVKLTIEKSKKQAFDVLLRIPGWATKTKVTVNGKPVAQRVVSGEYLSIHKKWNKGDLINIEFPMDVKLIEGNQYIEEVRNQLAVKRGPVVYCLESADLGSNRKVLDTYIQPNSKFEVRYKPNLLGGLSTIESEVKIRKSNSKEMYSEFVAPTWESLKIQFIPYYAWSNRGVGNMSVWLPIHHN
ncbi:glycoside hydrolase family 127 protein [Flavicella sediminum]|uniref:glycoside hydrolase family 127 protein n=1 Tax=Flavicella sediminum TaxID=2585141 RepID=UPI0011233FA3|nr:beta-L-arabinofuranosidase domain-containing protein [Flavicella sediminum]